MARRVSKKTRERVGKAVYTIFLLAFAFVLVCISFIALSDWRSYLVAYERSQPEPVVEAYMAELRETVAIDKHDFDTDWQAAAKEYLENRTIGINAEKKFWIELLTILKSCNSIYYF